MGDYVERIYLIKLEMNDTPDKSATYFDVNLEISDGRKNKNFISSPYLKYITALISVKYDYNFSFMFHVL